MHVRPSFADYIRQVCRAIFRNIPIVSSERLYAFVDRPMLILLQFPIVAAIMFIYNYSPVSYSIYHGWASWIAAFIGLALLAAYWLFFVYRFCRFRVEWEDFSMHPDGESAIEGQDSTGEFLHTPQNRRAAWKSRGIFALFTFTLAGITAAYCFLSFGLAPNRLYDNHTDSLNRIAKIAEDYESLYIYPAGKFNDDLYVGGFAYSGVYDADGYPAVYEPSSSTVQEINDIIRSLHNGYISSMIYDGKKLHIGIDARWGKYCELRWYSDGADDSLLRNDRLYAANITQLDEYWWIIWYDFDASL